MAVSMDLVRRAHRVRKYLDDHPAIYARFEREALRVASRRSHYSAKTIVEVLRHESLFEADPDGLFKVNNNLIPTLAHDFVEDHPELPGFFEVRSAYVVPRKGRRTRVAL